MPAVGANGDPGVEQKQGQGQEPPIDPRESVTDFVGMLTTECEKEEEEADRNTDPDARRPQRRLARSAVRIIAVRERSHRLPGLQVSCLPRGRLPGAPEPEYTRGVEKRGEGTLRYPRTAPLVKPRTM